jgi:hypothetical protein
MSVIHSVSRATVEAFAADTGPAVKREIYANTVASLIAFVVAFIIVAFVGKILYNQVVVELFTFAKPARSFWQIIGLMIFINLIRP